MARKLTEEELHQRNVALAELVCKREEELARKSEVVKEIGKVVRYLNDQIVQIAQEINLGEIEDNPPAQ